MRKLNLSTIMAGGFLLILLVTSVVYNTLKPRVMILHSYHPDYAWTRDIDVGLRRIVDTWTDYSVNWHYMDTKKHADPKWLRRAGIIARRAIEKFDPHVLISIDDLAQKLAASYYVNNPDINIVFAGVNGSVESYGYDKANNVTGIFERKQLQAARETVLAIERGKQDSKKNPKLLYILDPSGSLQRDRPHIDAFDWSPVDYIGSFKAENFDHWQEIVLSEGTKVDTIILSNYRKLPRSKEDMAFVPPEEVMAWTEKNSSVPVIGFMLFNVEDGGMLSVGVSPYEQGEVAAKMAERIIEEEIAPNDIPMVLNKQYVVSIRESAIRARNIKLPSIYEAFGRATANYRE